MTDQAEADARRAQARACAPVSWRWRRGARAFALAAAAVCAVVAWQAALHKPSCACAKDVEGARAAFVAQQPTPPAAPPQPAARGRVEYAEFDSASLGQKVRYAVSLPAGYDQNPGRRYPVVIFLHGLNNTERDWEAEGMQARLEELRAAGRVGDFILAAPFGANSFYLNAKNGARYEDAVVKDFIPFVDKTYRTLASRDARVVEGISMGGFGALLIAFKHPELFAGVAAHSAALFDELPAAPADPSNRLASFRHQLASRLFGSPPDAEHFRANNPLQLARANAARLRGLKIYFDVGDSDRYGFQTGNRQLDEMLTAAGIAHEFHLAPGGHGWSFLTSRAEPALAFVWNAFRKKG
ncbi:MAG TPA: alpha/beta hydrolase-fold protein [Pyrinomonadaceae bacterium]|nr:alpha/beta hydrolase-fold protein [Pyrinomonadaceae bacterium]